MSAEDIDYTDLAALDQAVISVRQKLPESRQAQAEARMARLQARLEYQHARNLSLAQLAAETEANRAVLVEMKTAGELSDLLIANGVYEQSEQYAKEARADLESLKEQGNNLRRQIEMGYR